MDRAQALNELRARVSNGSIIRHSLAVEAIMRELAAMFKGDVEKWGLVGLLHDIDYDMTAGNPARHGDLGAEILENLGIDDSVVYSIKAQNDNNGVIRKRRMDKSLYAADPASDLIIASVLILPSKKLAEATLEFVLNRFNENGFAEGVSRKQIQTCSEIGLKLEQFMGIALNAMKKISGDLEL